MRVDDAVWTEVGVAGAWPGLPEDGVLGVVPSIVVRPASVEEVSRVLAWASGRGLKVVPCGTRTKMDRGAAPRACDVLLDMSGLDAVVEHAAGDLTVTVQPGVRLEELQRVLAGAGQFLAVDPPVPGSVGGLIATADSGPRRLRYGGVRDLILGVTFVRADGVVAKGGGRVVKNVAGYDMPKLLTGSLGTLGVIVEATFRLYPLPAASAMVVADGVSLVEAAGLARQVLDSTLVPTSLDYFSMKGEQVAAARFESSPRSVKAQAAGAAEMWSGGGGQVNVLSGGEEEALWARMGSIVGTSGEDVLARVVSTVTGLPEIIRAAQREADEAGVELSVRAHLGHGQGLLHWHEPPVERAVMLIEKARRDAEGRDSSLVVWRASEDVRGLVDVWGGAGEGLGLMRKIKAQFDPAGTLSPGRFVGGI